MAKKFEDEMAIRSLMSAYADAVNRRDPEGMAAVLAPDAIIEKPGYGDPVQGGNKILKRYRRLQRERRFLCQMVHSGVVHVDGDCATARWWFSETKLPVDSDRWLTMIGVYQDEVARLPQGWRFTRRIQTTIKEIYLPENLTITTHALPEFLLIAGLPGS
jgi:ketosteroid isomerase-like protein